MARSLFQKARDAVLGNMHKLLDGVANTPEAYEQRIRDLDNAIGDLRAAGDEQQGDATRYSRVAGKLQQQIDERQSSIDAILTDDDSSNDHHAVELQMQSDADDKRLQQQLQLKSAAEANFAEVNRAIGQLETQLTGMRNNLDRLRVMQAATAARTKAADAIETAGGVINSASSSGFDEIAAQIEQQNDTAKARFDRVVGGLSTSSPEQAAALANAKARIAERQAEISAAAQLPALAPADQETQDHS